MFDFCDNLFEIFLEMLFICLQIIFPILISGRLKIRAKYRILKTHIFRGSFLYIYNIQQKVPRAPPHSFRRFPRIQKVRFSGVVYIYIFLCLAFGWLKVGGVGSNFSRVRASRVRSHEKKRPAPRWLPVMLRLVRAVALLPFPLRLLSIA
jgi:hypothetical protein